MLLRDDKLAKKMRSEGRLYLKDEEMAQREKTKSMIELLVTITITTVTVIVINILLILISHR